MSAHRTKNQNSDFTFPYFDSTLSRAYFVQNKEVWYVHCTWDIIIYHGKWMNRNGIEGQTIPLIRREVSNILGLAYANQPTASALNHYITENMYRKVYDPERSERYMIALQDVNC